MEDAFTIGERLKEEALETKIHNNPKWHTLRSDVYVRDKGICWVCNTFVDLKDYDLGHLVDRCNGGQDAYDNLSVMHKSCNLSKPKHTSLEEAMKWKMSPTYLINKPVSMFDNSIRTYPSRRKIHTKATPQLSLLGGQSNNQLLSSYLNTNPRLNDATDKVRIEAVSLLSHILGIPKQPTSLYGKRKQRRLEKQQYLTGYKPNNKTIARQKQQFSELEGKTKGVVFICWVQGRPLGGAMWKVMLPPYDKRNTYTIRQTPPGATDDGKTGVRDTLQIIGGILKNKVQIDIGFSHYHISPDESGKVRITFLTNDKSNSGDRSQTIGLGHGQIPIEEWERAKEQGISLNDFKESYCSH